MRLRVPLHLALACVLPGLCTASAQQRTGATQPGSQPSSGPTTRPARLPFNGDFEARDASGNLPRGWTTKHPDNVRIVAAGGPRGLVVELTGDKRLMGSYGVDLTSAKIPVEPNVRYRCTGYTRSAGPNMKLFIKGYATVTRRVGGELQTFDDIVYQMRKDIAPSENWQPFTLEFEIIPAEVFSDFQHRIEYVRIRLWAYWPQGTCWFDDIRFERLGPTPAARRRHAAGVTHAGLPPRLGSAAQASTQPARAPFDEQQTWREAVNAFRGGAHERAARLATRLIEHAPRRGAYRVLAARALAALERWSAAEQQARWLLRQDEEHSSAEAAARQIEPWQRDWARVVRAQACAHTARVAEARAIVSELLAARREVSPHARAAAEALLAELERRPGSAPSRGP